MVAINRLAQQPWSIEKQRAAEQWLRDNQQHETAHSARSFVTGMIYGIAIGVILQAMIWR